jgi:hypothetical protein
MALPPQADDDRLDAFGLMLAPGGVVVMSDVTQAEKPSVHPASLPVALVRVCRRLAGLRQGPISRGAPHGHRDQTPRDGRA